MKKFTIIMIALLVASMSFAQTKQLDKPTFKAKTNVATKSTRAVTGTLQHCGDFVEGNGIGTGSASTLNAASRFEATDLTSYVGQYITKITVGIDNASVITSGKVGILTGTIDAPVVATQQACTFTTGINEITLAVPYQIPAETAIMIAYEVTVTGGYPLGMDAGPAVTNGDLLCIGAFGNALVSMTQYSLSYNNVITATVEDEVSSDPVMIASPSELSFLEEVNNNSDAQVVSISAANLTSNITASVTGPFEISADNTTFGTTANFTSDGGSLYVRFSPTAAGNATGSITISSTGVDNATIALSGFAYDCGTAITAPWTETFDINTSSTIYCWSVIDANNDNNTYSLQNYNAENYVMYINYADENDDYLVTPTMHIGTANYISFKVAHRSNSFPETYEVYAIVGDTRTQLGNTAQTTTVMPEFEIVTFDLAAYEGQDIQIGIRNHSLDQYTFYVDDFSLLETPTAAEIALTSVAPESGSSIVSGQDLTISGVVTNNGVELTSYTVSYTVDGGAAVEYNVTGINVAQTGTHNFTHATPISGLTPGSHTIVVTVSNPNGAADNTSDNSQTITINVIDCSTAITEFPYVENFDNGTGCWTFVDADADGNGWVEASNVGGIYLAEGSSLAGSGHNSSAGMIVSGSYSNVTGALTPDNWAISPALDLRNVSSAQLSFYAAAQDGSYPTEHYGVYVSTTTNDISAFTLLWEETMDANGGAHRAQGAWGEKTTDLTAYAGQTIYIAFRHFDCTDAFLLDIDDVTITATVAAEENIAEAIAVYPNPTSSMVTVANAEGKNIVIVNSLGQVVANIENAAANQTIDVANFANGTYFVKVDAEVVKLNVVK